MGKPNSTLTQVKLKEILHYCPETGVFTWIAPTKGNTVYGAVAGWIDQHGTSKHLHYRRISIKSKNHRAHRLAFLFMTGRFPVLVDHIDGNGLNNAWINLREIHSAHDNQLNARKASNNTSGVRGVSWHSRNLVWTAKITMHRKQISLYWGDDFFDAVCARKSAEVAYGFHANHGR